MPRAKTKPKGKPPPKEKGGGGTEKPQRERFIETAREIGVDETGNAFMRLLRKVLPVKRRVKSSKQ
jgi:hypothetical protein